MAKFFVSGLRPGNEILERPYRRGTLVGVFNREQTDRTAEDYKLLVAVSNENGEVEADVGEIECEKPIRLVIVDRYRVSAEQLQLIKAPTHARSR